MKQKSKYVLILPRAFVVCLGNLLACVPASASVATFNENSSGLSWTLPAVTNLLADPQVTITPATANVPFTGTSSSWTTLTDGLLAPGDPNPGNLGSVVAPSGGNEVIFNLDVAGNGGMGFNITSFDSYCQWNDGGRNNQDYTLAYSVVGDETNFIDIGTVSNHAGGKSTHSRLVDGTGILASNVAAVKIHFNGQENGWVGYSEFILSATPVVPTPIEVVTLNEASNNLGWTLPAGSNLLDATASTSTPALQSPPPGFANAVSTNWGTMTDGLIGNPVDDPAVCAPFSGGSVIFPLKNLATNSKGYELTSLDFYCAWADAGRDDMHMNVSYSTYQDPTTFIPLSTVDNVGGSGNKSTHTRLSFLASNVVAIKIDFPDQENGWVGYREFIALGTASPLAAPLTWTGATSGTWTAATATNWTGLYSDLAPLNFVQAASNKSINVPSAVTASSMTFSHTASPAYVFSGSQITVTNGLTSIAGGAATFANTVKSLNGVAVTANGALTFDGDLESDGLNLTGPGVINLNADNDNAGSPLLTGTVAVGDGTLNVGHDLSVKAAVLSMTGGVANFATTAPSVSLLSGTGGAVSLGTTALTIGTGSLASQSAAFSGSILQATGSGSLIKAGASSLTLGGENSYTGPTHVVGGTLEFALKASLYHGDTASWTSGNLVVDSGATVGFSVGNDGEFDDADLSGSLEMGGFSSGSRLGINTTADFIFTRSLTGGAGLYKKGSPTLTITGNNSYTGNTTISEGTLVAAGVGHVTLPADVYVGDGSNVDAFLSMGSDNQFGPTSVLHLTNQSFNNSECKVQLRGTNQTIAGLASPPPTTGNFVLSVVQNDDATVPDFTGDLGLPASLTIDTPANTSYSYRGIIRDEVGPPLSVTKNGPGTQELVNILNGSNSYTGPTTVNAGTFRINFANGDGNGFASNITVNSPGGIPATLNFHSAGGGYDFDRIISGAGKMLVTGTNPISLTNGLNSWTGGTIVDGGFLALKTVNGNDIGGGTADGQTCIAGAMTPSNVIQLINGGTLSLDAAAPLGQSTMLPAFAPTIIVNQGSRIYGGTNTVAFVPNITLNGGSIEITGGANTGSFDTNLATVGTVTVAGSVASTIFTNAAFLAGGATPSAFANMSLGSLGAPGTTFLVGDVTGDGASDLTVSSILRNVQSVASPLTKDGPGTMELQAANTYTGTTTVSGGTLSINNAYLADTADVVIATGATLKLAHVNVDTVGKLILNGMPQATGIYGSLANTTPGIFHTASITGTGMLNVTNPLTDSYASWATVIPNAADRDLTDDPDGDGFTNLQEYLLGGSPIVGTGSLTGIRRNGGNILLSWAQRADGTYTLEQSQDLSLWTPITPLISSSADQTGLYSADYIRKEATIQVDDTKKFVRVKAIK